MKRKIIITGTVLVLLALAYWVGRSNGNDAAVKEQMKRDLKLHGELVDLDRSFLTNVVTKPNTMTSGIYTLEIRFAGMTSEVAVLDLEFANGNLVKPAKLQMQDILQTGNVVSWERYDMDEGPSARFVGLTDGNVMWGRVYTKPGQGWREGEPPAYGVWRLYPKADK